MSRGIVTLHDNITVDINYRRVSRHLNYNLCLYRKIVNFDKLKTPVI